MTWDEIKEIDDSNIGYIGHHSHTHEYLIDMTEKEFINDIDCLLYTSPSPRDWTISRMPSSA